MKFLVLFLLIIGNTHAKFMTVTKDQIKDIQRLEYLDNDPVCEKYKNKYIKKIHSTTIVISIEDGFETIDLKFKSCVEIRHISYHSFYQYTLKKLLKNTEIEQCVLNETTTKNIYEDNQSETTTKSYGQKTITTDSMNLLLDNETNEILDYRLNQTQSQCQ